MPADGREVVGRAFRADQQLVPVQLEQVEAVHNDLTEVAGKVGIAGRAGFTYNDVEGLMEILKKTLHQKKRPHTQSTSWTKLF